MKLPSLFLQAFLAVARKGNFTSAAQSLHITQPALSQRILKLEDELSTTLIIRDPAGLKLTPQGEELLRYCEQQERLEDELLGKLGQAAGPAEQTALTGVVRIGGYSTVMRSMVMPALDRLVSENPELQVELMVAELRELPQLLRSGKVDYLVLDRELRRPGVVSVRIGEEENVWIQPAREHWRPGVFLDHDAEDQTTRDFFRHQGRREAPLTRSFLGDIYAIIDGVSRGWGEAIVPRHLIEDRKDLKIVARQKPLRSPIYLNYFEQPFYTTLQKQVLSALTGR